MCLHRSKERSSRACAEPHLPHSLRPPLALDSPWSLGQSPSTHTHSTATRRRAATRRALGASGAARGAIGRRFSPTHRARGGAATRDDVPGPARDRGAAVEQPPRVNQPVAALRRAHRRVERAKPAARRDGPDVRCPGPVNARPRWRDATERAEVGWNGGGVCLHGDRT